MNWDRRQKIRIFEKSSLPVIRNSTTMQGGDASCRTN
jgi:hypothetical protein